MDELVGFRVLLRLHEQRVGRCSERKTAANAVDPAVDLRKSRCAAAEPVFEDAHERLVGIGFVLCYSALMGTMLLLNSIIADTGRKIILFLLAPAFLVGIGFMIAGKMRIGKRN